MGGGAPHGPFPGSYLLCSFTIHSLPEDATYLVSFTGVRCGPGGFHSQPVCAHVTGQLAPLCLSVQSQHAVGLCDK